MIPFRCYTETSFFRLLAKRGIFLISLNLLFISQDQKGKGAIPQKLLSHHIPAPGSCFQLQWLSSLSLGARK
jgi:hypothetical protein